MDRTDDAVGAGVGVAEADEGRALQEDHVCLEAKQKADDDYGSEQPGLQAADIAAAAVAAVAAAVCGCGGLLCTLFRLITLRFQL